MMSLAEDSDDWQGIHRELSYCTMSALSHSHADANIIHGLKVSAQPRCTTGASSANLPVPSPCPQMAIMNRNKMRLLAEADNMGRCPGGYSRLSARWAAVVDCGQLRTPLWILTVWTADLWSPTSVSVLIPRCFYKLMSVKTRVLLIARKYIESFLIFNCHITWKCIINRWGPGERISRTATDAAARHEQLSAAGMSRAVLHTASDSTPVYYILPSMIY